MRSNSRTHILAEKVLNKLDGNIEEVNLEQAMIMPLTQTSLQERDSLVEKNDFDAPIFKYANQFVQADEIVIAAPYWDLSFPSTVRIYFEAVTVSGLSFKYTPDGGVQGLCKAKRIIYVTTAGGSIMNYNMGYDYIKALAKNFYGIPDVLCFKAENLDIAGANVQEIIKNAIDEICLTDFS